MKGDFMKFQWEDNLMVGVPQMDREHKELIEKANTLFEALGNPEKSTKEIIDIVNFLTRYVVNHFNSEERLQKKYNYPDYNRHHKLHEDFKANVMSLKADIEANGLTTSKKLEINRQLIQWLQQHIGKEDKKLGDHIKANS